MDTVNFTLPLPLTYLNLDFYIAATEFAKEMGFPIEDLHSNTSIESQKQWLKNNCQPNCRMVSVSAYLVYIYTYHALGGKIARYWCRRSRVQISATPHHGSTRRKFTPTNSNTSIKDIT